MRRCVTAVFPFPSVVFQQVCLLNKDSYYHFCHLDDLVDPFSPTKDEIWCFLCPELCWNGLDLSQVNA